MGTLVASGEYYRDYFGIGGYIRTIYGVYKVLGLGVPAKAL